MGSFPSQEQAVHPSGLSDTDGSAAGHQHHLQTRMRTRHTLIKKLTRGRLLVLGLDGAGKSTIVHHLIRSLDEECTNIQSTSTAGDVLIGGDEHRSARVYPNPSKALQSWRYRLEGDCYLQLLDVPGKREFRRKWYTTALAPNDSTNYSSSSSSLGSGGSSSQAMPLLGVVFVVDASDHVRFPVVADELIRFQKLKEQKKTFQRAQFFLLLNKTDQAAAAASTIAPLEAEEQRKQVSEARRVAMRIARRELKKCVDHQLRMDQKRNPNDYRHPSSASAPSSSANANSSGSGTPLGAPPDMKSPKAHIAGSSRAALSAEASASRTTAMMTSVLECSAHDRESIKAIHAWIKEEIKKVM